MEDGWIPPEVHTSNPPGNEKMGKAILEMIAKGFLIARSPLWI
jgi:hypothetical protein